MQATMYLGTAIGRFVAVLNLTHLYSFLGIEEVALAIDVEVRT